MPLMGRRPSRNGEGSSNRFVEESIAKEKETNLVLPENVFTEPEPELNEGGYQGYTPLNAYADQRALSCKYV